MRTGIVVGASTADRVRLEAVVADRNSPQKHVWRAQIVLLTADGCGAGEIMRRTGKAKTAVWRWQERFMQAGVEGLLRDKARPPRCPALAPQVAERDVALTLAPQPGEVTQWTGRAMAKEQRHRHQEFIRFLNAVEGFSAKHTKRRLQRGVFYCLVSLQAAINRFVADNNANPRPFQ